MGLIYRMGWRGSKEQTHLQHPLFYFAIKLRPFLQVPKENFLLVLRPSSLSESVLSSLLYLSELCCKVPWAGHFKKYYVCFRPQ